MKGRVGRRSLGLAVFACVVFTVLAFTGGAAAEGEGQPFAENLVEIKVVDRAAIEKLMSEAEAIGAEFNDHYLRENEDDGTLTVQVLGDDAQIEALRADGYEILRTVEDEDTYWERIAERAEAIAAERRAEKAAQQGGANLNGAGLRASVQAAALASEITINRVDYFENYAGRFLSVEAHNSTTTQTGNGGLAGQGPALVVTWNEGAGTAMTAGGPRTIGAYVDTDPNPDTYLYHRTLIRLGAPGTDTPPAPTRIRVASSTGAVEEADVDPWLGTSLPPHADGFLMDFHDRYMDPTEVYERFEELALEFPNIAQLVDLPNKTNGYQRKAMAHMDPAGARLVVDDPSEAAGTYGIATTAAAYGPAPPIAGLPGQLVVVDDGSPAPSEGCGPLVDFPAGAIAVVDRGNCPFVQKTQNAQNAGASAVVVVNNVAGAPTAPGGTSTPPFVIPTVMISLADGTAIKDALIVSPATGRLHGGAAVNTAARVVLVSRAWGHQGGNDLKARFVNPGGASRPLSVSATGNEITVSLGTSATGALNSTAAQVVAAINANAGASALVKALTYRGSTGTGVVQATGQVSLSDFLSVSAAVGASGIPHGNAHVARGPFQPKVMRISKRAPEGQPDPRGDRVGIYLFCQQHAREWVTPITCLETAERLLRNYGTDSMTKDYVDNLDIYILPSVNPDGGHYSFYNFQSQRRNMTNHCVNGAMAGDDPMASNFWTPKVQFNGGVPTSTDADSRNTWGVDLNRNQSEGTIFDGYVGASHACTSDTFAGPAEVSEPEAKNEKWIVDELGPNIKFSNNIHTSGGYFMWAPGAYTTNRTTLPAPNIGIEKYFFAAAETVLGRIKEYRGNVVLPQRTGPIADVLYSAAGNSADDNYYRKDIIGYSFEAGADVFTTVSLTQPAAAGATGVRVSSTTGMAANDYITVGWKGANSEVRRIASISSAPNPNPNVILQTPLENAHASGEEINGGTAQTGVGFFPNYATEGKHEANEFANGNYGLLEAALAFSRDKAAPQVRMTGRRAAQAGPLRTTFEYVNEPSVIRYTTDGSTPTLDDSTPKWERQGLRRPGEVFEFTETTTVRWLALDLAGNTSTGQATFWIETTPPTITLTVPVDGGQYLLGSAVNASYSCGDTQSGVARCEGTAASGSPIDTASIGPKTFTVNAEDEAGNTASVTHTYNVHWPFSGFKPPFGKVNEVNAGSTFPVKFTLGGDRGLSIFAAGSPSSRQIDCASAARAAAAATPGVLAKKAVKTKKKAKKKRKAIRSTANVAGSLVYQNGLYQLDWRTSKAWAGTCREFSMTLVDNRTYTAVLRFK